VVVLRTETTGVASATRRRVEGRTRRKLPRRKEVVAPICRAIAETIYRRWLHKLAVVVIVLAIFISLPKVAPFRPSTIRLCRPSASIVKEAAFVCFFIEISPVAAAVNMARW